MLVYRALYSYTSQYIPFFAKPVSFLSFVIKEFWLTQVCPGSKFTFWVSMLGPYLRRKEAGANSNEESLHDRQRRLTFYHILTKEMTEGFWAGKWHHQTCHWRQSPCLRWESLSLRWEHRSLTETSVVQRFVYTSVTRYRTPPILLFYHISTASSQNPVRLSYNTVEVKYCVYGKCSFQPLL